MAYTHTVVPIDQVRPHPRNPRTHTKKQIRQIAASIRAVGFAAPVLIDEDKVLIAGVAWTVRRSRRLRISGSWANTGCCVAMREALMI
jgi:hypothetical protein